MICPNLGNKKILKKFEELKNALGSEPLAYLVYHRSEGKILDMMNKNNPLFAKLLQHTKRDRGLAIQYFARQYSSKFYQKESEAEETFKFNEEGEIVSNITMDTLIGPSDKKSKFKISDDEDLFRVVPSGTKEYKIWNKEKELEWFKTNFPGLDIEIVKGLIEVDKHGGQKAWGVFKNSMIYISDKAKVGTTYHEAFHAVFHMYLTPLERLEILREVKKGRKMGNLHAEEKLAEMFSDYVLSQEQIKPTGNKILDFFRQLYQIIKNKLTNNLSIDTLFSRMNNGHYAKNEFKRDISKFSEATRFSTPQLTLQQEDMRATNVADAMRRVLDKLYLQVPNMTRAEFVEGFLNNTFKGNRKGIDILLAKTFNGLATYYKKNIDNLDENAVRQLDITLENIIELTEDFGVPEGRLTVRRIGDLALRKLAITEGMDIRTKGSIYPGVNQVTDPEVFDVNEEEVKLEGWQVDNVKTSRRNSASSEIRKELSYIPLLDKNREQRKDDVGLPRYLNAAQTYGTLIREMADLNTKEEMLEELEELVKYMPEYSIILEKMKDDKFKTLFFQAFQNTHAPFYRMISEYDPIDQQRVFKWFPSNRQGITASIVTDWKNNYYNSDKNVLINSKGEFVRNEELEKLVENLGATPDEKYANVEKLLNSIGIEVSEKEIRALKDVEISRRTGTALDVFWTNIKPIVNLYLEGKDPYKKGRTEGTLLTQAAKQLTKVRPNLQESAHQSVEGKTYYSHILSFFASKQIQELKKQEVLDEYLNIPFYSKMPWLNRMNSGDESVIRDFYQDEFQYALLDGKKWDRDNKGSTYSEMSPKDLAIIEANAYLSAKKFGWYRMPTLSNSPAGMFIKGEKFTPEEVVDHMYNVALSEWARIQQLKLERVGKDIENYGSNGLDFHFIPKLNSHKALFEKKDEEGIKKIISDYLESKANELGRDYLSLGITTEVDGKIESEWITNVGDVKEALREFSYNSILANTQMISIFQGDPAFYKNTTDFFKRAKEVWSPGLLLDSTAKYNSDINGVLGVKSNYKTAYLNDVEIFSTELAKDILDALIANGVDTTKANLIAAKYGYLDAKNSKGEPIEPKKINVTDAQGFITLDRYMEYQIGLGRYNYKLDKNYGKLKRGETVEGVSLQPLKPFLFTHKKTENLIIPTQNKNSEFVLLPALAYNTSDGVKFPTEKDRENNYADYKSPKLAKILDFMQRDSYNDDKVIDSVQFETAAKVGLSGAVELDYIENAEIHILSNKDIRLQQETPDHYTDDKGLIGTQGRKLIISDISDNIEFDINGEPMISKEMIDYYQAVVTADIIDMFNSVDSRFKTIEDIQKLLLEEVVKRELGNELIDALQIVDGKFKIPLFHPLHAKRTEALIGSVFKNKVVKQKAPGGNVVQVSGVGFSDDLKIIIEDSRLKEVEVYLPWWMKDKYADLMENGELSIARLEELGLDKIIGYRIPTEDKYSILPLKIKGFLPRESGGAIMLPPEITTLNGSDFDIDKMFLHLPSFYVKRNFDFNKLGEYFKDLGFFVEQKTLPTLFKKVNNNEALNRQEEDIYEVIENMPQEVKERISKDPKIVVPKLDRNKPFIEQSRKARDNAKLDIFWGVLTNKDTFEKIINPGNFDDVRDLSAEITKIRKISDKLDIATPRTSRTMFVRNMAGNELIGMFANHNVNHAILQHTGVRLKKGIPLNFQNRGKLNEEFSEDNERISKNLAQFLAAVVDNAKEPISSYLNVNAFTADVLALLLRTGFSIRTAVGFLNQPYIRKLTNEFKLTDETSADYRAVLGKLRNELAVNEDDEVESWGISQEQLFNDISGEDESTEYRARQLAVLNLFDTLRETSYDMRKLIGALRTDNIGRQITLSSNEIFQNNYNDIFNKENSFEGIGTIWENYPMMKAFYDYSVTKTTDRLSEHYIWNNRSLKLTKERIFENLTEHKNISQKQLEDINYEFLRFLTSDYFEDTDRGKIVSEFPSDFTKYVKANPELMDNEFINKLAVESKMVNNSEYDTITYANTGATTHIDSSVISNAWLDLLNDEKHVKFAESLIHYSYFTSGYQMTPKSFGHLIPVDWYARLDKHDESFNEYLYGLQDTTKDDTIYLHFINQFYRNNWENNFFVPAVDLKNLNMKSVPDTFKVSTFAHPELTTKNKIAPLVPFMTIRVGAKRYLYERYTAVNEGVASYRRAEPLGIKNIAKEYSINEEFMKSAFAGKPVEKSVKKTNSQGEAGKSINIYAGANQNTTLSNFAKRPFTAVIDGKSYGKFDTVEAAFQMAKLLPEFNSSGSEYKNSIVAKLRKATGSEAKSIGKNIKGLDVKAWDAFNTQIMKQLIKQSFEQNSEALQKLLATGNIKLTHFQDKSKWGKEFPRILMEVRQELSTTKQGPATEQTDFTIKPTPKTLPAGLLELKDGKVYTLNEINGTMLSNMGYSVSEINELLKKKIC